MAWDLGGDGDDAYALEGAIFVTGAAVQWLRDGLGIIDDAAEIGPLAASVADTGGVVLVPAFTGLGSPWWDPYARGTVLGITRGTGRAHLARAVVEAMAFQTRDVVEAMSRASGPTPIGELRGRRRRRRPWTLLLQLQADQLRVPVRRPAVQETTALGAAYLAGLGRGRVVVDRRGRRRAGAPTSSRRAVRSTAADRRRRVRPSGSAPSSGARGWAQPAPRLAR